MSAFLFGYDPRYRAIDANGNPIAGAKLYFYVSPGTTPTDSYTTAALSTPNANPVVADSGGLFGPMYLSSEITYRVKLTTSAGVEVWDQSSYAALENLGQTIYPLSAGEIAAGVTPVNYLYAWGNVLRYGTNTTPGTTDMYAAIQAAIDSLPAPGGGTVFFPTAERYQCSQGLTWSNKRVTLEGVGGSYQPVGTKLRFPAGVTGVNPKNGSSGYGGYSSVKNLCIEGSDTGIGSNVGLLVQCPNFYGENVVVQGFGGPGFKVLSALTIADVTINANGCAFINCTSFANYSDGWHSRGVDSNGISTVGFKSINNLGWGFWDDPGAIVSHNDPLEEGCGETLTFTGAFAGGETSGTLTASHANGTFIAKFSNGVVREVTIAGTAVSWTGALGSSATTTLYVAGGYGFGSHGGFCAVSGAYHETTGRIGVYIASGGSGYHKLSFSVLEDSVHDNSTTSRIEYANNRRNKQVFGTDNDYVTINDDGISLDLGKILGIRNAAADALWQIYCHSDKTLRVGSAQLKAVALANGLTLPAGTTAIAALNIPHGSAPSSPVNGDIWTTTAGLYVRINGSTIGPLT
jgi:hypothetical protein